LGVRRRIPEDVHRNLQQQRFTPLHPLSLDHTTHPNAISGKRPAPNKTEKADPSLDQLSTSETID
jgi:hypothetical protein